MQVVRLGIAIVVVCALAGPGRADSSWHAGLNVRAELGTHPIRVGGGIDLDPVDLTLVLDPMFWTDGQHDVDVLVEKRLCACGWALLTGWRTSAIGLLGGHQFQEKLLVGVSAPLPDLGPFRTRWSFELATVIVKHGADLPADWISFASGRDFIDLVNFGMFVRIEYASAL